MAARTTASWVNTTATRPLSRPASSSSSAPATRAFESARVSRPFTSRAWGSDRHRCHCSGHRSAISSSVQPSHSPTRSSPKRSSTIGARPRRAARGAAVCTARTRGLETSQSMGSCASTSATAPAARTQPGSMPSSSQPIVQRSRSRPCGRGGPGERCHPPLMSAHEPAVPRPRTAAGPAGSAPARATPRRSHPSPPACQPTTRPHQRALPCCAAGLDRPASRNLRPSAHARRACPSVPPSATDCPISDPPHHRPRPTGG